MDPSERLTCRLTSRPPPSVQGYLLEWLSYWYIDLNFVNKMTARNDVTGDELKSKTNNDKYRDGWDRIFKKKEEPVHPDMKSDDNKDEAPVR